MAHCKYNKISLWGDVIVTMMKLDIVADYLRATILKKHHRRLGWTHCEIPTYQNGIELRIAMEVYTYVGNLRCLRIERWDQSLDHQAGSA